MQIILPLSLISPRNHKRVIIIDDIDTAVHDELEQDELRQLNSPGYSLALHPWMEVRLGLNPRQNESV